jgi:hypothetical protein
MKEKIKEKIQSFDIKDFYQSSMNFFNSLGYKSDKTLPPKTGSYKEFFEYFSINENILNSKKLKLDEWNEIQFLFQFSNDELINAGQISMFYSNKINTTKAYLKSYLFISIALKEKSYTKTQLVEITRFINSDKIFQMPVLILFHYNNQLCLSVIDRRMNKRDPNKSVLEKVTLIKDIRINEPHRAHIEILNDLHLSNLNVNNFDQLHKSFKIVLNTKELNKRFYIELSNWYFRAMNVCKFPNEIDEKNIKEISLIRFISRILFAWFLKEKGLISDEIFTQKFYNDEIKHDTSINSSRYYKAVLQNLFFATLNCKLPDRDFQQEAQNFYNKQYMVFNKYRYKDYLENPDRFLQFFKKIPFLNGGLFECLDCENESKSRVCIDCFSNNEKFRAKVIFPDSLFFNTDTLDFSALYNDKRKSRVAVKGLFDIFNEYKFTIDENTPIEQEIALDPELLGQTLENLLASYNPETQATARKSTGSYYTPREIVDYMVDESLIAYLSQYLKDNDETLKDMDSLDELLRDTFAYTEKEHPFNEKEVETIIDAVFKLKMLDPACGSGAFPMGILLKMVYVLERIDPENRVWKRKLLDNIPDEMKSYIEVNTDNFSRKLGLIWNCIYGVDIQTIAIQLTKLRFFISLIVEENVNWNNEDNFGILPLPNLETKFVAANTLIGIERPAQMLLGDNQREEIEKKIKSNRLEYFNANSRREKKRIKDKDKKLRNELAEAMKFSGFDDEVAQKIANWEPYDINHSADWFDPEYMFMVTGGFDIIIGNPPYGAKTSSLHKLYYKRNYYSCQTIKNKRKGNIDTYVVFIEQGLRLLGNFGILNYIVPLSITSSESNISLHNFIKDNCSEAYFSNYSVRPQPIFLNAVVNTSIINLIKSTSTDTSIFSTKMYRKSKENTVGKIIQSIQFQEVSKLYLKGRYPKISDDIELQILEKLFKIETKISDLITENGQKIFYRFAGGRYFKIFTNYSTNSSAETSLSLLEKYSNSISAVLSSNLFFWYYQIYSDNLNMKSTEVVSFPFPKDNFDNNSLKLLEEIYSKYLVDIEKNASIRKTTKYANIDSFKEYKIGKSKKIIDEIDDFIYQFYDLTEDEIEYVKNYEIDFRITKST